MRSFTIVVAADANLGIGKNGTLPWKLKEDMKHFRELTTGKGTEGVWCNAVIMGRKTWESIPEKFRPLPNRINVVLSKNAAPSGAGFNGAIGASSLDRALEHLPIQHEQVFVIGGGAVYAEAIEHPACAEIVITRVGGTFECDTFFPRYDDRFRLDSVIGRFVESGIDCSIERWLRC